MTNRDQLWKDIKKRVKDFEEQELKKKKKAEIIQIQVSANVVRRRNPNASACSEKGESNGQ